MLSSVCLRRTCLDSTAHVRHATGSALNNLYTPRTQHPSNQVWKFKSNPREEQRNSAALKKTGKAFFDANSNRRKILLPLCLEAAAQMKLEGTRPDRQTYHVLLESATNAGAWRIGQAILDDMLLVGIKPDTEMFNILIHAHRQLCSPVLWKIFDKMNELGVQPDGVTYSTLIVMYTEDGNLELALRYFQEMKSRKLTPGLRAMKSIVLLAAELGHPRLAIDIAAWFESKFKTPMDKSVWLKCLTASAQECYGDGVRHCWSIIVDKFDVTPDEGVCLAVLYTAARHGLTDLATDVLRVLKSAGVEWEEHHYASIIEAFCRNSQLKEALVTLNIMRSRDISPDSKTTRPILDAISTSTDTLDETWRIIEEIQKEHYQVDTAALNVLIQASVQLGDLQRAMGSYKSFEEYHVSPDIETFNILLDGCIASKHRQLGDVLLDQMKAADLTPTEDTFERMIYLCLTQDTYEDAFFYLEEMKAAGHVPPLRTYAKIIRKCIGADDPRYKMALEEMTEIGYSAPKNLLWEIKEYEQMGTERVRGWSEEGTE